MAIRKVGRDISAAERWLEVGERYRSDIDGPYHRHRLSVIVALLPDLADAVVVDLGCGEGVLMREALRRGARSVVGIDIDTDMLRHARAAGAERLLQGGVERLADVERADCVIAANVLAYCTDEEESRFYAEAARVLPSGGSLVVTHSNELFDVYTFNNYTVEFFARHFGQDVTSLLAHPELPDRLGFNVRANPLSYEHDLARHGFRQERIEYISRHPSPPLLVQNADWDDIDAREYPDTLSVAPEERWKLAFQCSMFGVRARRLP